MSTAVGSSISSFAPPHSLSLSRTLPRPLRQVQGKAIDNFISSDLLSYLSSDNLPVLDWSKKGSSLFGKMIEVLSSYTACKQLFQMFVAIFFFHSLEYILAIVYHGRSNVTLKSLLISNKYLLAMVFSLLEYFVEIFFFPGLKEQCWLSNVGLSMVVIGEIIRKMAIITAGQAFTHIIRVHRTENHKLVMHGVYGFVRHPSYMGFFMWSVGTQIMLCNPISTIAFAIVVWRFFAERIPYEEHFLRQFFGSQHVEYAKRVPSGLPFM